jgi:hypothetical protein
LEKNDIDRWLTISHVVNWNATTLISHGHPTFVVRQFNVDIGAVSIQVLVTSVIQNLSEKMERLLGRPNIHLRSKPDMLGGG